jgi:hypothetical protein
MTFASNAVVQSYFFHKKSAARMAFNVSQDRTYLAPITRNVLAPPRIGARIKQF